MRLSSMPHNGSATSLLATLFPVALSTNAASSMSEPTTSSDMSSVTSSRVSAAGHLLSNSLDGPPIAKSGLGHVRVSRFRAQDSEKAMPTNDTSGPLFTASSPSATLQRSLESRLRARMDVNGSPEYALTWSSWDMPSGPPICALRALGRRKAVSGYIGWPTPRVGGNGTAGKKYKGRIEDAAVLASGLTLDEYKPATHGVLNVELCRWLQGFPGIWSNCADMVTP
jgi:hypothetical protein